MGTMPWSEDTRCLYCDGKLPLFRKLKQGQFCSREHQEAYWREQDQLALEVLHRTHEALQAYRPKVSVEEILGPAAPAEVSAGPADAPPESAQELCGPCPSPYRFHAVPPAGGVWAPVELWEYEWVGEARIPRFGRPEFRAWPSAGFVPLCPPGRAVLEAVWRRLPADPAEPQTRVESRRFSPAAERELSPRWAGRQPFEWPPARGRFAWAGACAPLASRTATIQTPRCRLSPQGDALEWLEQAAFPFCDRLCVLAAPAPHALLQVGREAGPAPESGPGGIARPRLEFAKAPLIPRQIDALLALGAPSARALAAGGGAAMRGPMTVVREMDRVVKASRSRIAAEEPPLAPPRPWGLGPVAYRRDAMAPALEFAGPEAGETAMPRRALAVCDPEPRRSEVPVAVRLTLAPQPGPRRPRGPRAPEPFNGQILFPRCVAEPAGPAPEHATVSRGAHSPRQLLAGAVKFWNQAPRDLKILLFLTPLALGLALNPSLPKVSVRAPQAEQALPAKVGQAVDSQWARLRKAIAERAAIALDENFRSGLDNWLGNSGSTAEWAYDQAGFVLPGRVALYQPSLGLTDYELQFLGAVDKGALSWVVRAADFHNYYVVKLVVRKPGPVPQLGITRYAVIDGVAQDREDTPVALNARADSLYRVSLDVKGDHYALAINGQMMDSWREPRLKRGGVGFFTNRGEQSRIGWVQITHQYDLLGRIFAYLAP
jgi:hypothetical protein